MEEEKVSTAPKKRTTRSKTVTEAPITTAAAEAVKEETAAKAAPVVEKKPVPKEVDMNQYVTVRNGAQGRLVYKSKKTGEPFVWDEFGAEQEMQLYELKNAKSSAKSFYVNNWFLFDEDWVIDFLGVGQYYKHALKLDNFDDLFDKSADEIEETVSHLSSGQKKSVAYRARQLIKDGRIDSNRTITALEKSLGIDLIER